jgi:hypothetical protein
MNQPCIGKMICYAAIAAFLLIGCHKNPVVVDTSPAFSNLNTLGDNKTYTTYTYKDRWKKKLDTLTVSFDYNTLKVQSISIKVTLDSEKTWLPIATLSPGGSGSDTVHWIPKSSSDVSKYFGIKRCFVRISDTITDSSITSDTFSLIGAIPVVFLDSLGNDTFHMADSIKVKFGVNMDLASSIRTFFKTDSMNSWIEFTNDSNLPSPYDPQIVNTQRCLIPDKVDPSRVDAKNFAQPIKILIKDYGVGTSQLTSDYITIVP